MSRYHEMGDTYKVSPIIPCLVGVCVSAQAYRPACVRMNDTKLENITPSTPMTLAALAREIGTLSETFSKLKTATNQVKTNFSEHVSQKQNGGCSHVRFPTFPVQQSDEQFLKSLLSQVLSAMWNTDPFPTLTPILLDLGVASVPLCRPRDQAVLVL